MKPPAPFKQIDLLQTMRGTGFPSKKLDYVTQRLGLGQKTKHKGMELWKACIAGDQGRMGDDGAIQPAGRAVARQAA
jgi:hypothetical protein